MWKDSFDVMQTSGRRLITMNITLLYSWFCTNWWQKYLPVGTIVVWLSRFKSWLSKCIAVAFKLIIGRAPVLVGLFTPVGTGGNSKCVSVTEAPEICWKWHMWWQLHASSSYSMDPSVHSSSLNAEKANAECKYTEWPMVGNTDQYCFFCMKQSLSGKSGIPECLCTN